ncbi:curli assembly protein CsgF [Chryseobacterium sp.]|uniref:curli production assembly/transport component CsgF n=1 Tax=Chryseobacterium sp. TaxID=1871047 RepID=UPI0028979A3E|nr:curli assembly protein CsgF [Chryseobacterium sp.]
MKLLYLTTVLFLIFTNVSLCAQQLVYKPINPAFGGDTFNYQWLLSSATAQNQFDDASSSYSSTSSSLGSFTDSLNRQLLSQLSTKLFGNQFGEGDLKPGTYIFGSMYLEVTQANGGLLIKILNTGTGEQSEIIIPGQN